MPTPTIDDCYTVTKFAYATGIDGPNIPWTKLQASNLFALIRGNVSSLSLRVVQKTTVLESVNISPHITRARQIQDSSPQFPAQQLPIFGITRNAALALRYYLDDGRARRIQMTFDSVTECRQVVEVLAKCGLSFQEPEANNARPRTASSLSQRTLDRHPAEPIEPSRSHPTNNFKAVPMNSPGPPDLNFHQHSAVRQSSQMFPSTLSQPESQHSQQPQHTQDFRIELPRPPAFTRDISAAPRKPLVSRPTTSQFFADGSHLPAPAQTRNAFLASDDMRPHSVLGPGAHDAPALLSSWKPVRHFEEDDPSSGTFGSDLSDAAKSPADQAVQISDQQQASWHHPNTATSPLAYPPEVPTFTQNTIELLSSDGDLSTRSRPLSSSLTLPPLPKPKILKEVSPNVRKSFVPHQIAQTAPNTVSSSGLKRSLDSAVHSKHALRQPVSIATDMRADCQASAAIRDISDDQKISALGRPSKVSRLVKLPVSHAKDLQGMGSHDSGHQNRSSEKSPASLNEHSSQSAPAAPKGLLAPEKSDEPSKRQARADGERFAYEAHSPSSESPNPRIASLEAYAMQDPEARQAALDQLFISHLENPAFLRLCEDVQNNWRRFALGL